MFDKKKDLGGVILGHMDGDGEAKDDYEDDGGDEAVLHTIAADLIDALHARDTKGVVDALKAFKDCVEAADQGQDEADQA